MIGLGNFLQPSHIRVAAVVDIRIGTKDNLDAVPLDRCGVTGSESIFGRDCLRRKGAAGDESIVENLAPSLLLIALGPALALQFARTAS